MTINHSRLVALVVAIAGAATLRLLPHPPNFTPIGAIALFSGAHLGRKPIAFLIPLIALFMSDLILGFYHGITTVYGADLLIVLIGILAGPRSPIRIGSAVIVSSFLFFITTNLGVWYSSGLYPLTASGIQACFVAAIPFFQNSLAGDLFYGLLLFGGFAMAERLVPRLKPALAQPE